MTMAAKSVPRLIADMAEGERASLTLAALRDTLPPTLISGELRAKDAERAGEVDADAWIDHENAEDYVLVESSVKVTPELVVSVLWWKDQSQLRDLDSD